MTSDPSVALEPTRHGADTGDVGADDTEQSAQGDPVLAIRPLPSDVIAEADFGGERREDGAPSDRYALRWRRRPGLTPPRPGALVVCGLNPSGAGADVGDATLSVVWGLAGRLGFDELVMLNLFPRRATQPKALLSGAGDLVRARRAWIDEIRDAAPRSRLIVLACGGPYSPKALQALVEAQTASFVRIARAVRAPLHALALTKDGHPHHPLYLPGDVIPVPWCPPGQTEIVARRYPGRAEPVVDLSDCGGSCPVAASGTIGGLPFAVRARGDKITLRVAPVGTDPVDVLDGDALLLVSASFHGAVYELGHLPHAEAVRWTRAVLAGWAARAPRAELRRLVELLDWRIP